MDKAAQEARRAYKREWQRRNRDKVKQYQEKYWTRKAQQAAAAAETETDAEPLHRQEG